MTSQQTTMLKKRNKINDKLIKSIEIEIADLSIAINNLETIRVEKINRLIECLKFRQKQAQIETE